MRIDLFLFLLFEYLALSHIGICLCALFNFVMFLQLFKFQFFEYTRGEFKMKPGRKLVLEAVLVPLIIVIAFWGLFYFFHGFHPRK
ncbi:hypothetical protein A3K92_09040 [Thermococcus gorgonarius]|uniref:Uncharacterized protein n=1 Tax=Thermococcus gorgonarius TaxID=71997 RepID=A0A2Z2M6A2_THEGO|nr:hypothetical protein A3K92_09040 [Thermococcus gorgonarius]